MSDSNDILEFLVKCLLNNKINNKPNDTKLFTRNDIINSGTVSSLLKKNIHHAIQKHFSNENLNNNYINYRLEYNTPNYNF